MAAHVDTNHTITVYPTCALVGCGGNHVLGPLARGLCGCEIIFCWIWPHTMYNVTHILMTKYLCRTLRQNIMQAANAPFCARLRYCGSLLHIWPTKRPAQRKSVMPHSGRILCHYVIPSAVRGGGPRRAYQTRGLRMRHGVIFHSRTGLRSVVGTRCKPRANSQFLMLHCIKYFDLP